MKSNALKQTKLYITYETDAYNVDKKRKTVYANLHEFVYAPGTLEAFLLSTDPKM